MTECCPVIYDYSVKDLSRTLGDIQAGRQLRHYGITASFKTFQSRCYILGNEELGLLFDFDGTATFIGEGKERPQHNTWMDLQRIPGWNPTFDARLQRNHLESMSARSPFLQMKVSEECAQLFREAGLTRTALLNIAGNIVLRPDFREFIIEQAEMRKREIAVISYGVHQVIQAVLENHNIHNLVTLFAERFAFSGNELLGIDMTAPRVVPALKGKIARQFLAETGVNNAIGIGDSQGDIGLLKAAQLGILLIHDHPSSPLLNRAVQRRMHATTDVFVVNSQDQSFQQVPALFNRFIDRT